MDAGFYREIYLGVLWMQVFIRNKERIVVR